VLLLEREREPQHKVCGEFLSQEAVESLRALGVDPADFGAKTIHSVRLAGARGVTSAELPFTAMSMTRRQLDEALLQRAEQSGVNVCRGRRVVRVRCEGDVWSADVEQSGGADSSIAAKTLFVATGKHDVMGLPRLAGTQRGMVGFKMYFRLRREQAEQLNGHVELLLFRGGLSGLQLVEDGSANLGCIVQQKRLRQLGGRWENLLEAMRRECSHLADRLAGAEALLERPLAIAPIPYGYVREAASDGLWALGDQAAVIPSFTGDGMAIALHSGRLAATMYLAGASAEAFQRRLRAELAGQVGLAVMIARGLVWEPTRGVMLAATHAWPGLLTLAGRKTRIAESVRL
jgi:flavin-dependent dehydrogenase